MTELEKARRTIFIGNLHKSITEDILSPIFGSLGKVVTIRLSADTGAVARFAFIEFEERDSAVAACQLDKTMLGDRAIKVEMIKTPAESAPATAPSSASSGVLGAFPTEPVDNPQSDVAKAMQQRVVSVVPIVEMDQAKIREMFGVIGPIVQINVGTTEISVEYATPQAAMGAVQQLDGVDGMSVALQEAVKRKDPRDDDIPEEFPMATAGVFKREEFVLRTVHAAGVDQNTTEKQIQEFFSKAIGEVTRARLAGAVSSTGTRFAFVEFLNVADAQKALQIGSIMFGDDVVKINPSKTAIFSGPSAPPTTTYEQVACSAAAAEAMLSDNDSGSSDSEYQRHYTDKHRNYRGSGEGRWRRDRWREERDRSRERRRRRDESDERRRRRRRHRSTSSDSDRDRRRRRRDESEDRRRDESEEERRRRRRRHRSTSSDSDRDRRRKRRDESEDRRRDESEEERRRRRRHRSTSSDSDRRRKRRRRRDGSEERRRRHRHHRHRSSDEDLRAQVQATVPAATDGDTGDLRAELEATAPPVTDERDDGDLRAEVQAKVPSDDQAVSKDEEKGLYEGMQEERDLRSEVLESMKRRVDK